MGMRTASRQILNPHSMFDFVRKIFGQNRLTTLSCMPPYFAATYSLIGETYESSP
jgi:hypothetical protein